MIDFRSLLLSGKLLQIPGAHDALSARMIQEAGFTAYGVGGAALSVTQLALPDISLQSFGEYRDAVGRIMEGSSLPVMIDGENGFGDAKAITRTIRSFERMGVAGIAFEDLFLPPVLGRSPRLIERQEMQVKLEAALAARCDDRLFIIGRTDAAHTVGLDEALLRARQFETLGVDAVLVTGLADRDAFLRLRDAVKIPIFAVVVPGIPWFAPTPEDLTEIGIEAALYPAAVMTHVIVGIGNGLNAIRSANGASPPGFSMGRIGTLMKVAEWQEIDQRFNVDSK